MAPLSFKHDHGPLATFPTVHPGNIYRMSLYLQPGNPLHLRLWLALRFPPLGYTIYAYLLKLYLYIPANIPMHTDTACHMICVPYIGYQYIYRMSIYHNQRIRVILDSGSRFVFFFFFPPLGWVESLDIQHYLYPRCYVLYHVN